MTNEYYKNLPRKRMSSGALFLNKNGEVLIVKPGYKDHWSIPGGIVEENESPKSACVREVKEEIGLDLVEPGFLCVDHVSAKDGKDESLQFIFDGGTLEDNTIKNIVLDQKEIVEYRCVRLSEAERLLSNNLKIKISRCLAAIKNNKSVYLENGR